MYTVCIQMDLIKKKSLRNYLFHYVTECMLLGLNYMFALPVLNLYCWKDCFKKALALHIQPEMSSKVYVTKTVVCGGVFSVSGYPSSVFILEWAIP